MESNNDTYRIIADLFFTLTVIVSAAYGSEFINSILH